MKQKRSETQLEHPRYEPDKTLMQVVDDLVHNAFWVLLPLMPYDVPSVGLTPPGGALRFLRNTVMPSVLDKRRKLSKNATPAELATREFIASFAVCLDDFEYIAKKSLFDLINPYAFQRNFAAYHMWGEKDTDCVPASTPYCLTVQTFLDEISTYFQQPLASLVVRPPGKTEMEWDGVYVSLDEQARPILEVL